LQNNVGAKTQGNPINKTVILKYLIYLVYDINMVVTNALHHCPYILILISRYGILEINVAKKDMKGKGKGKAIPVQIYYRPTGFQEVDVPDFETVGT